MQAIPWPLANIPAKKVIVQARNALFTDVRTSCGVKLKTEQTQVNDEKQYISLFAVNFCWIWKYSFVILIIQLRVNKRLKHTAVLSYNVRSMFDVSTHLVGSQHLRIYLR